MKQVVQLYIDGQQVELFGDESISLNQSIKNANDISKVFTEFSQSFTVPASRTNNKIFKHYYNFDIVGGFDARKKASANIELNSLPFRDGKIRLEGVEMRNNKAYSYKITFFGNTIDLKDLIGEDKLSALTWLSNFSRTYSDINVALDCEAGGRNITVDSVTYQRALKIPLISVDGTEVVSAPNMSVDWDALKYGIRIYLILKAIEEDYGIEWASDSFFKDTSNAQFYDLYMWMHKSKGRIDVSGDVTELYEGFPFSNSMTRVVCTPSSVLVFGLTGGNLLNYDLDVTTATINDYKITIKKDGVIVNEKYVSGGGNTTLTGNLNNTSTGYEVFITGTSADSFTCDWDLTDPFLSETHTYSGPSQSLGSTYVFNPINELPEMKVIDFISAMFKMFNLVAYVQTDGKIQVQTLDDYRAAGTSRDVTKYIDVTSSSIDLALPYKQIDFQYTGRGTKLAKQFEQENNIGWGTIKYDGGEKLDGDVYSIEVPFEHMQFIKIDGSDIQYGSFIDDNDADYFGNPLLFYGYRVQLGDTVTINGYGGITYYTIPSNSVDISASSDDDTNHFSVEINEYTPADSFLGSLYLNYYSNYIAEVFNSKRRLIKLKAFLPVSFLINYSLADTLIIGDQEYRINSINSNLNTGESSLELYNI